MTNRMLSLISDFVVLRGGFYWPGFPHGAMTLQKVRKPKKKSRSNTLMKQCRDVSCKESSIHN